MRFTTDDQALEVRIDLDDEPADLTRDGLGAKILELNARGLYRLATDEKGPDGQTWAPLKAATVARKKHGLIGLQSGAMLQGLKNGYTEVEARYAIWGYPPGPAWGRTHGFHNGRDNGQVARPIIGWTWDGKEAARALLGDGG